MIEVYIGLGSNLGDRHKNLLKAIDELRALDENHRVSTFIESTAVHADGSLAPQDPDFINALVECKTDKNPQEVLQELLKIEAKMGRVRTYKGAPREIDLDLIAYGDEIIDEPNLQVPHPHMIHRSFVLAPLAELNPTWVHPSTKKTAREMLDVLISDVHRTG